MGLFRGFIARQGGLTMTRDDIYKAASKELYGCFLNPKLRACLDENNRECFVDGAEWRINSVWHDSEQLPDIAKPLLVEHVGGVYSISIIYEIDANRRTWKRWAYVKDLLPIKDGDK